MPFVLYFAWIFISIQCTVFFYKPHRVKVRQCSVSGRSFGYEYSMSDTFENSGEDNSQDDVVDIIVLPDAGDEPRIVGKGFPQPPPHYFCEYSSIVLE